MYKGHLVSLVALAQAAGTWAATVTYNWDVTWVTASPDGFSRPVIGINGEWPCPPIKAAAGDTIVVNMKNSLGNETTGLHFHGMAQVNSNFMDGASMVNQCPVPPGSSITYSFIADAPGTYWYHSHNMGQYPDGLRGPLIVSDPKDPYAGKYDEEIVLTVSDWYHSQTLPLVQAMLQPSNTHFQPPIPDAVLVNEGGNRDFDFQVGKTYRVRIISFAALGSAFIEFGSHQGSIIMIDGSYVQPQDATLLRVAPAQRYDLLISAVAGDKGKNYPYLVALDINPDFSSATPVAPITYPFNLTGYLVTDSTLPKDTTVEVDVFQPFDDSKLNSFGLIPALAAPTKTWTLDFNFCLDVNGIPRACFNNQTYISQKVPTLYSAATLGDQNANTALYGDVSAFVVNYGDTVDIVVNNLDAAIHPFHLHGHQFQIIERAAANAGTWSGTSTGSATPATRDVLTVNANSYAVLRFTANNPGVFLFHCHIEWHVEMGLTATLIEAPEKLHNYPIPKQHLDICKSQNIPIAGNAAGNTQNVTDTSGFNTVPPTTYTGAMYTPPVKCKSRRRSVRRRAEPQAQWS